MECTRDQLLVKMKILGYKLTAKHYAKIKIYHLYTYIYKPTNIMMTGRPGHLTTYCTCALVITVKGLVIRVQLSNNDHILKKKVNAGGGEDGKGLGFGTKPPFQIDNSLD